MAMLDNNNENNMEHIFKKVKDTLKRNRNNYNESSTDTSDDVIISKPIKKKRRKNINNDNTHDIRKIKNRQSALLSREKRKKQLKYLDKKIPVLKKLNKIDLPYLVKKSENVDTGCIDEDYDLNMKRNNNKCVNEMKELRDILNKAEFDENELECIIKHEIRDRFDINIDYMSENSTDDNNDDNNNNNFVNDCKMNSRYSNEIINVGCNNKDAVTLKTQVLPSHYIHPQKIISMNQDIYNQKTKLIVNQTSCIVNIIHHPILTHQAC
mmetsp:Transcript_12195/g.15223  ORF Transcript_12195/g.15223 Transcript_12195/m.15223 type:complete len:267 (-) Transcript_12195:182-982(-)